MSIYSTNPRQAPHLFDVHTHLQFAAYAEDRDAVIRRTLEGSVWFVNVGTQKDTSVAAVELAHTYDGVWATVGLHPIHTEKSYHDSQELGDSEEARGFTSHGEVFEYEYYKKLAGDPKVVAIGECGLDYYRLEPETKRLQAEIFEQQIALSGEVKKPLMIHCRNAFSDLIDILVACRISRVTSPGIVHFFSGSIDDARKLLDLGFSFSFGGVVTFAKEYHEKVSFVPLDRIVLETDAPYVAPVPYRGKRNEPLFIEATARKVAEIKGISYEIASAMTTTNAKNILKI